MVEQPKKKMVSSFAALQEPVFRRIWTTSVLANFGQLILGVGAAWEMTRLSSSAQMVALVQSAMMLPLMLMSAPAGAIADMFDRRKIAMAGLAISIVSAGGLSIIAALGLTTPWILIAACILIGSGVALYSPAWQASISEQVDAEKLPGAIALGSVSYNLARSFGPALGGVIVMAAGVTAAFAVNAIFYIPLFIAFFLWKRRHIPSRLPPERIDRAMISGARYALHSQHIRLVLIRAFLFGLAGAGLAGLGPLIARDLLHGDAATYGLLLGAGGVGAVIGALGVARISSILSLETATRIMAVISGLFMAVVALSHSIPLTAFAMFILGGANITTIALYNVAVQMGVPRWVTARALSLFAAALTGGIAIGAWVWGVVASHWTLEIAMLASAACLLILPFISMILKLPDGNEGLESIDIQSTPTVDLSLSLRSGPIVIEIDYHVAKNHAREFYDAMLAIQKMRLRNGSFDWSIARDIGDAELWTERFQCPTWADYLRTRERYTEADHKAQAVVDQYLSDTSPKTVRRRLVRPFGSVRWHADSPDNKRDDLWVISP
jgi:MFS family permease